MPAGRTKTSDAVVLCPPDLQNLWGIWRAAIIEIPYTG